MGGGGGGVMAILDKQEGEISLFGYKRGQLKFGFFKRPSCAFQEI